MTEIRLRTEARPRRQKLFGAALCFLALLLIGLSDYRLGYRISLLVFYAVPIGFATVYAGPAVAVVLAVLAVVISRGGDLLAGMPYPGNGVFIWNAMIPFVFFNLMIALLYGLNRLLKKLEGTVEQRNTALLQEMTERGRLEREVIELSEREHRRFGQELHDLVSQELAGIAIDAHLLTRQLLSVDQPEAVRARELALKVDRALTQARNLARGFFAVGFDAANLAEALLELAKRTEKASHIPCVVRCQEYLVLGDEDAAVQLFRIAQEAVQNAVRHAAASRIEIAFERKDGAFHLTIEDNGKGLQASMRKGLGLSIMAYRAGLIGGKFTTERPAKGGTRVLCLVPVKKLVRGKDLPARAES